MAFSNEPRAGREWHDAIGAIYGAAVNPAAWPEALQKIADYFGDFGAVMLFGKENGSFGVVASPAIVPMTEEYLRDWAHRDVRAERSRTLGYLASGNVATDRHILTEEEMDREPHYRDFLARYGLRYFAGVAVSPTPQLEAILSVQRRRDRGPYGDDELEYLGHLATHVERALGLGIKLLDAEIFAEGFLIALDRLGHGVIALGDDGHIWHSNAAARRLFGDGLLDRDGCLGLEDGAADAQFRQQMAEGNAFAAGDPGPVIVIKRREGGGLVLRLMPLVRKPDQFLANASFLALVTNAEEGGVVQPALLKELYALTHAEAKLAAIIGAGQSPTDAAARLGITDQTARSVLKRIFDKMGISRQGELVHMLSRLAIRA